MTPNAYERHRRRPRRSRSAARARRACAAPRRHSTIGISTAADALIATAATSATPAPTSIHAAGSPTTSGRGMPSSQAQARRQRDDRPRVGPAGGRARAADAHRAARSSSQKREHEQEEHQEVVVVAAEPPHEHDRVERRRSPPRRPGCGRAAARSGRRGTPSRGSRASARPSSPRTSRRRRAATSAIVKSVNSGPYGLSRPCQLLSRKVGSLCGSSAGIVV